MAHSKIGGLFGATITFIGNIINRVLPAVDDNLETFSLLWLDTDVNATEENRQAQLQLRQIINHLKTFDNSQQCHQYILSIPAQDRVVLIVSGRLGRQLVPQIHDLRHISSIYVYCRDKEGNERWAKGFNKV
jgi:plasmid stabilization system protein ParE